MDLDVGMRPVIAKELQQLRQVISSVPIVVQPIQDVSPTSNMISIFSLVIGYTEVLKCFQTPSMKPYDRTVDPEEHVLPYREE